MVGVNIYIPMAEGKFHYLSVWMDLCSRKIVGWDLQDYMRESLVTASLHKALRSRKVSSRLLIHSDRRGQYAEKKFRQLLHGRTLTQSMSDADNPYDNANMEILLQQVQSRTDGGWRIPGC